MSNRPVTRAWTRPRQAPPARTARSARHDHESYRLQLYRYRCWRLPVYPLSLFARSHRPTYCFTSIPTNTIQYHGMTVGKHHVLERRVCHGNTIKHNPSHPHGAVNASAVMPEKTDPRRCNLLASLHPIMRWKKLRRLPKRPQRMNANVKLALIYYTAFSMCASLMSGTQLAAFICSSLEAP